MVFFICNLLLSSILTNFQTLSTFWPESACTGITKIDIIKKNPTDHLDIFTEGLKLMSEKVCKKNGGTLRRRFVIIQDIRQGGGVFIPSPVIGGLTWSDPFALAERAVLLPCKPRPLGDDWWRWDTFSVDTNGRYSIIFPSMYLGKKVH